MVAVDDDVEGTGIDGVEDREPNRSLIEQGLRVALAAVGRQRLAIKRDDRKPLRPDRPKRRIDEVAGVLPVVLGRIRYGRWPMVGRGRIVATHPACWVERRQVFGPAATDRSVCAVAAVLTDAPGQVPPHIARIGVTP